MADKEEKDVMSWERPWDIEEMRKHAESWSLAGDAGMLLYLQSFSQELLAHTHSIQEQLNDVNREMKLTDVRVNNTFNDFIMLANSQFVENRVYDEDVTVEDDSTLNKKDAQEKSQEQKEAELIPKITEALTLGLNVIDTAFEKLDINEANSSSEEDNIPLGSDMLLEPKDMYLSRPLPYLIGSINFMHDDSVGLAEASSDEEEEDAESKEDVSSASEPENDTTSKIVENPSQKKTDWSKSETSSEDDEDLFAAEESKGTDEEQINENKSQLQSTSQEPGNFLNELSTKLKPPDVVGSSTEHKKQKYKHKDIPVADDLFCHVQKKSPERDSDEEDSLFKTKSSPFQKSELFDDDDDDEGDLFGDIMKKGSDKESSADNKFAKENSPDRPVPKKTSAAKSDLFDDDNESDDDLFAIAAKSSVKAEPRKPGGLFSEQEEKHEVITKKKTSQKQETKKKVLAGAVSMFGPGVNPLAQAIKQQRSSPTDESVTESDSESDHCSSSLHDTDTSSSGLTDITAAVTKLPSGGHQRKQGIQILPTPVADSSGKTDEAKTIHNTSARLAGGLFDDDEDDLFATVHSTSTSSSNKTSKSSNKPLTDASSLFVDEDDDLFSSITKSTMNKKPTTTATQSKPPAHQVLSLFDDEDNADDIFSAKTEHKEQLKNSSKQSNKASKSLTIFDDEDVLFGTSDDGPSVDLFGSSSPLAVSKKVASASTKVASDKDDLSSHSANAAAGASSKKNATSKGFDLFLDNEDSTEDLFAVPTKQNNKSTPLQSASKPLGDKAEVDKTPPDRETVSARSEKVDLGNGKSFPNKKSIIQEPASNSVLNDDSELFKPAAAVSGLFVSAEDELFSTKINKPEKSKPTPEKDKSLFLYDNDDDDEEEDLFSSLSNKANKSSSHTKSEVKKASLESDNNLATTDCTTASLNKHQSLLENQSSESSSVDGTLYSTDKTASAKLPQSVPIFSEAKSSLQHTQRNKEQIQQSSPSVDGTSVIDFDQPVEVETLSSTTKARARIAKRRRPPTRHKMVPGAASAVSGDQDVADFYSSMVPVVNDSNNTSSQSENQSLPSSVTGKSNTGMPSDLPVSIKSKTISLSSTASADTADVLDQAVISSDSAGSLKMTSEMTGGDDLFCDGYDTVKPKTKSFPPHVPVNQHAAGKSSQLAKDSLRDDNRTGRPSADSMNSVPSQKVTASIFDEVDDIFADSILNKPKPGKMGKLSKDDLFGGSEYNKVDDIFGDDDDDGDIFAKKVTTSPQYVFSGKTETLGDEDLFGSATRRQTKANSTEITGKAAAKTTQKKESGKNLPSIFDDDDDLFAPKSATVQASKASNTNKHASGKAKLQKEDIFADDDSNIFDDPLLVTKKQ